MGPFTPSQDTITALKMHLANYINKEDPEGYGPNMGKWWRSSKPSRIILYLNLRPGQAFTHFELSGETVFMKSLPIYLIVVNLLIFTFPQCALKSC